MYEDEEVVLASLQIPEEESTDPWFLKMIRKVEAKPTEYPWWKIINGRLYHYRPDPTIEDLVEDQDGWKMVLPREKCSRVLSESHEEPTAGHFGRAKTYE